MATVQDVITDAERCIADERAAAERAACARAEKIGKHRVATALRRGLRVLEAHPDLWCQGEAFGADGGTVRMCAVGAATALLARDLLRRQPTLADDSILLSTIQERINVLSGLPRVVDANDNAESVHDAAAAIRQLLYEAGL